MVAVVEVKLEPQKFCQLWLIKLHIEGGKGGCGSRFTTKKKAVSRFTCLKKQFHGKLDSNKIVLNNNRFIKSMLRIYALSSVTSLPVS